MASITLMRPHPCPPAARARPADDGWLVVARSLDDRDASGPSDCDVRDALASIAAGLRTSGLGPERALVLVKGLARGVMDARREPLSPDERTARLARIVAWTIEGYYADA